MNHSWEKWQPFPGERKRKRCRRCLVWEAVVWGPRQPGRNGARHHGWVRVWLSREDAKTELPVRWPGCVARPAP